MALHRPTPWQTQNFLSRRALAERLVDLAHVGPHDLVLDLGAGRGELTAPLAARARRVIAVEKDPLLAAALRERFKDCPNVSVRADDALATGFPREPFTVVANIPFDLTSRLISRLTSARHAPRDSHIVVQREAAERVLGQPRETLFGILRKPWFEPRLVHRFQRTDFAPPPRVDVVFLRLHKRGPPLLSRADADAFRDLVTYCFLGPAPHLRATLGELLGHRRAQRLLDLLRLPLWTTPSGVPLEAWLSLVPLLSQHERQTLRAYSNVTTSRAILRSSARRMIRPARWPASRRHA